jgi:2'-5' RNA ligase
MKRTFFAVDILPDRNLNIGIQEVKNALREEKIKWIPDNQWHLTLKFLGDTPQDIIQPIIVDISDKMSQLSFMKLHLFSIGLFKNLNNPRILWIGIKSCETLMKAAKYIDEATQNYGFKSENKEFSPHLTIGRIKEIKQINNLGNLIEKYKNTSFGMVTITEIILYESILKSEGPVYLPLHKFSLSKASDTGSFDNG